MAKLRAKLQIVALLVAAIGLCTDVMRKFVASFDRVQIRIGDTESLELPAFSSMPIRNLTDEEVAQFKRKGFVVIRNVLPQDYIQSLQVYERSVPSTFSSSENHLRQPGVEDLLFNSPILPLVSQATGARSVYYIRDRIFSSSSVRRSAANAQTLAMQDGTKAGTLHVDSGPVTPASAGVSAAFALTSISEAEGCTEFIDTDDPHMSHLKVEILKAHGRQHLIEDVLRKTLHSAVLNDTFGVEKACMEPGDLAIFNFNALHRSGGTEVLRKKTRVLWTVRFQTEAGRLGWDPMHAQASLAKELEFSWWASNFIDNALQSGLYEENICLVWEHEWLPKEARSCSMVNLGILPYTRTLLRGLGYVWASGYSSAVATHSLRDIYNWR